MSMCRRFKGAPVMRLIVSVPVADVAREDLMLSNRHHPARGCRAEFVRLAISEKLVRDLATLALQRPSATQAFVPTRRAE